MSDNEQIECPLCAGELVTEHYPETPAVDYQRCIKCNATFMVRPDWESEVGEEA